MNPVVFLIIILVIAFGYLGYVYLLKKVKSVAVSIPYTVNLTNKAKEGNVDPVVERDEEIERMIHILKRRTKNNPLLIGMPGVGKTSLVESLAQRIETKNVPPDLQGKTVLELDMLALMSDTKMRGDLETKLKNFLRALESFSDDVILFVDEIHRIQQVSGTEGAINLADSLKPMLTGGDMSTIGATTWEEYMEYIHEDQALDRRFQIVLVDEPSPESALKMLQHLRPAYEEHHQVKITDEALKAAVDLSDEKIDYRYLPDKAIDLIDEAAAKVSIDCHYQHALPLGVVHAASKDCSGEVLPEHIREVVDQWVLHDVEDKKRDPRFAQGK